MGKIQPAHELAWFLCVMGSSGNQSSTRLSESGSGFRAICTHKFKGAVIVKLSVNKGRIETADIVQYRESEVYRLARDTFDREERQEQEGYIPETDILVWRNFLILNTLIRNGQRARSRMSTSSMG
uniref:Uncharacterized protein n=1 Tax=Magallana gigas TaxID=29159 RepID=K1RV49_MAGGI